MSLNVTLFGVMSSRRMVLHTSVRTARTWPVAWVVFAVICAGAAFAQPARLDKVPGDGRVIEMPSSRGPIHVLAREPEYDRSVSARFALDPVVTMVSACDNGCYCITWISGSSAWVEVRCPSDGIGRSGWSHDGGPADGSSGTWTGDGRQITAPQSLPGMPLSGTTYSNFTNAKGLATTKLRGTLVETHVYEPNACTELFDNSPLGMRGIDVLATIIWRDGTGVLDADNNLVCSTADAWTMIPPDGQHARVVFICPNNFNTGDRNRRAAVIIHEALHVAGQLEDKTGTVGPGDPPTTGQISANVKAACSL